MTTAEWCNFTIGKISIEASNLCKIYRIKSKKGFMALIPDVVFVADDDVLGAVFDVEFVVVAFDVLSVIGIRRRDS